ncbi:MAG: hypothetical protein LBS59_09025 [Puniceicoccales bacterium]|jgi:hypothetical protein|nr:hypothetical protein [Puniceicoccales bacterium]
MSIEHPFFCWRFSREDYITVARLRLGFAPGQRYRHPHYDPVVLDPGGSQWHPDHRSQFGASGTHAGHDYGTMDFQTARWAFAERVYALALIDTHEEFPSLRLAPEWTVGLVNWRFLNLPPQFADAGAFLLEHARRFCASGEVAIETGCTLNIRSPKPGELVRCPQDLCSLIVILDAEKLEEDALKPLYHPRQPDLGKRVPVRTLQFGWDEIAPLFHRPTPLEVELINSHDALPPATALDLAMIERASHFDLDGVLRLVGEGANLNAFDKNGESALTSATLDRRLDDVPCDQHDELGKTLPPLTPDRRIGMLSGLLDAGASINLASYEEADALINATLAAEPETVRFLLSRGADPNFNPWPEDEPDRISQALDYASTDAWLERGTPEGEAYAKIETMLEAAGAV